MVQLLDALRNSISSPVFLYQISPTDGSVIVPTFTPFTAGTYTAGTLPYGSTTSGVVDFYFSDAGWTAGQTQPPDLLLNFVDEMPSGLTFSRSGSAWGWDANHQFTEYTNDVPRVGGTDERGVARGILIEGTSKNWLRHNDLAGAVAGSPGTMPTNWSTNVSDSLLRQIVGTGLEDGMPYIDLKISGTSSGAGQFDIFFEAGSMVAGLDNEDWTVSCFLKLVNGSLLNLNSLFLNLEEQDSGGSLVALHQGSSIQPTKAGLSWQRAHLYQRLNGGGSTAYIRPWLSGSYDSGVSVDVTLRISLPQLEKVSHPTSPIVTTGSALQRNVDVCTIATDSAWWDSSGNMIFVQCCLPYQTQASGQTQRALALDDGSGDEVIGPYYTSGAISWQYRTSGSAVATLPVGTPTYNVDIRIASRYEADNFNAALDSGSLATDLSGAAPSVTTLRVGHRNPSGPTDQWRGYISKIAIWKGTTFSDSLLLSIAGSPIFPPEWARPESAKANVNYEGRCSSPSMERTLPLVPESGARSVLSIGDIRINNTDGYFDTLVQTYAVDGRDVLIKLLEDRSNQYEDAVSVFSGVGVSWSADKEEAIIHLREKSFFLDVPLLSLFGGTGSGDGTSANVGHPIPQAYGVCRNIEAELVDPSLLIYRFHDREANAVNAVYDRGAPVTAGSSYSSYANLAAASTASGHFDWALTSTGSYFRLGSSPSGTVTADVEGDADSSYASTTGAIIKKLLLRGTDVANVDTDSLDAIDTALPNDVGIYFNSQINISQAIDQVCSGTFTFWGDIGSGMLGVYQLKDPTDLDPDWEVNEYAVEGEVAPVELPASIGPTVWRRRIGYKINWSPLRGTDIVPAPTITEARRKELQDPYQSVTAGDADRLSKNLLAVDAPMLVSIFDDSADANALADSLLAMYAPGRQIFSVPVGIVGYRISLNDIVLLKWPRFGLEDGLKTVVVGLSYQGDIVVLTLFG